MARFDTFICCLLMLAATAFSGAVAASSGKITSPHAFQNFLDEAAPVCTAGPAGRCVDVALRYAAASPQKGLSRSDLATLRQEIDRWYAAGKDRLAARERGMVGFGLLLADGIGIPKLHAAFDADGDGLVSRTELLADVALDERPLGEVLSDPAAVDRPRLAERLGLPPDLVKRYFE